MYVCQSTNLQSIENEYKGNVKKMLKPNDHIWFGKAERTCNGLAVFWPAMDLAEIEIYGGLVFALSHEHVFKLRTAYAVT